jgi:hypothetical protein
MSFISPKRGIGPPVGRRGIPRTCLEERTGCFSASGTSLVSFSASRGRKAACPLFSSGCGNGTQHLRQRDLRHRGGSVFRGLPYERPPAARKAPDTKPYRMLNQGGRASPPLEKTSTAAPWSSQGLEAVHVPTTPAAAIRRAGLSGRTAEGPFSCGKGDGFTFQAPFQVFPPHRSVPSLRKDPHDPRKTNPSPFPSLRVA